MPIITLNNIQLGFGQPLLLESVNLTLNPGERVCMIGRNGTGKSTLMRLIAGEITADDGERVLAKNLRVVRLTQEVPSTMAGPVFHVVAEGLDKLGRLLQEYHEISQRLATDSSEALLNQLTRVQQALDVGNGWQTEQRIEAVISRLSLDPDIEFKALSGGLKRRVLLARALVLEPDLLLLDEPTNHLDIRAIEWLEEFLITFHGSLLFITHDRQFLRRLATRIIELDRGRLTDWPGDYNTYLQRKQEALNAEDKENARFDRKLAQEEIWIRQGIKARRTRNEGRVRSLLKMREQRQKRRIKVGQVKMQVQEGETSGKLVIEAENVCYSWDNQVLIRDFSVRIMRGDKLGLIGPNGVGKTTLLNLLLGKLAPDSGKLRQGSGLQPAYFDQLRATLNETLSVQDNVVEGSDRIDIQGQSRHIIGYLQDFLFTPERARTLVSALSGGERNRLLLAKLFTRPCNVLVMDEPTNDLDAETLDLLEERLLEFQGTLLLVSHDRAFLNHVVTSTLAFEGNGLIKEYVGGYDDWLRQQKSPIIKHPISVLPNKLHLNTIKKKLSFKDQQELEALPKQIEALEQEMELLQAAMAASSFYQREPDQIAADQKQLKTLEQQGKQAYIRWENLEDRK